MKRILKVFVFCFMFLAIGVCFYGCNNEAPEKYSVQIGSTENGSVIASENESVAGKEIVLTCVPSTGYVLKSLTVNGIALNDSKFYMPSEDVEVNAVFEKFYNVNVGTSSFGTLELSNLTPVAGEVVWITATVREGFVFFGVMVGQTEVVGNCFVQPASDVDVSPIFKKIALDLSVEHEITVSETENGTVTTSAPKAVCDEEITITAIPAEGYVVKCIKVNGQIIEGTAFIMPYADVNVEVEFERVYPVTVVEVQGGSVALSNQTPVLGETVVVNVEVEDGYKFVALQINSEQTSNTYFVQAEENVIITPIFEEIKWFKLQKGAYVYERGVINGQVASPSHVVNLFVDVDETTATLGVEMSSSTLEGNSFWKFKDLPFSREGDFVSMTLPVGSKTIVAKLESDYNLSVVWNEEETYYLSYVEDWEITGVYWNICCGVEDGIVVDSGEVTKIEFSEEGRVWAYRLTGEGEEEEKVPYGTYEVFGDILTIKPTNTEPDTRMVYVGKLSPGGESASWNGKIYISVGDEVSEKDFSWLISWEDID